MGISSLSMTKQQKFASVALFTKCLWQQLAYTQNLHTVLHTNSCDSEVLPEVHPHIPKSALLDIASLFNWLALSTHGSSYTQCHIISKFFSDHRMNSLLYESMGTDWLIYCFFQITFTHLKDFLSLPLKKWGQWHESSYLDTSKSHIYIYIYIYIYAK